MKRLFIGIIVLSLGVAAYGTFSNSWSRGPNYDAHFWQWPNGAGTRFIGEVEDYLDGTSGVVVKRSVEVFDANDTLTAAETGKTCVSIGFHGAAAGDLKITLPSAAAGLTFTFVDANAAAGDKINGGTAGKSYKCTGDAVKQSITIVARDGTDWDIVSEIGTWANDNN
jgi:hypothetical protein